MSALRWFGFAAGLGLYGVTVISLINTLVLPRSASSLIGRGVTRLVRKGMWLVSNRVQTYDARDKILAYAGPVWLLAMLLTWLTMVWFAFALLMWPVIDSGASFGTALELSGSSMFTLGFASPGGGVPLVLTLGAAASGIGVVSLMIAFLPTLYGAFNRREVLVTLLDAVAGSPAWGPEVLARQELIDSVESLDSLYTSWSEWSAEVSESHTSYRTLVWLRSPTPLRSWLTALLAMLDAAALHLSLNPLTAPPSARRLMRMGIVTLQTIAATLGLPYNADPKPDDPVQLTREDFDEGIEVLHRVGWKTERDLDDAWVHYRGWRVNYEQTAYGIAALIDAPPAPWSGPRRLAGKVIPPARPPHREPSLEFTTLRRVTTKRRAARGAVGVPAVADDGKPLSP
jgi:hypothetical protein